MRCRAFPDACPPSSRPRSPSCSTAPRIPRRRSTTATRSRSSCCRTSRRGSPTSSRRRSACRCRTEKLEQQVVKLDTQARQALAAGNEDLARTALERKNVAQTELQSLDPQIAELEEQQEQLTESEQKLRTKIEAFRTKKEVIKAQYSAAEAQVRISEAATGVGEEMADVGLAMQRALDKTENMKARADAVEELEAAGTFDDLTQLGSGEDDIDRQLQGALEHERGRRRAREDEGRARRGTPAQGELGAGGGTEAATGARMPAGGAGRSKRAPPRASGAASVIVRISTEGQYEVDDDDVDGLNELDNAGRRGRRGRRRGAFHDVFGQLLDVRAHAGRPLDDDELDGSDVILPPADISLEEAAAEFSGDGLIPD